MRKLHMGLMTLLAMAAIAIPNVNAADKAKKGEKGAGERGKVTAVSTEAKTITLSAKQAGDKTFSITDATKIEVAGKEGAALGDIKVGMIAAVVADADGKTAKSIRAQERGEKKPKK